MFYIFCFKILDKKGLKQKPDKKCLTKNVKHFLFQMLCFFVRIVVLRSKTKEALFFIFSARKDKEKIQRKDKIFQKKTCKNLRPDKKSLTKKASLFLSSFFCQVSSFCHNSIFGQYFCFIFLSFICKSTSFLSLEKTH
jgi:hypothetical protein